MARPGVRQTLHSVSNNVNKRASILRFYRPALFIRDNAPVRARDSRGGAARGEQRRTKFGPVRARQGGSVTRRHTRVSRSRKTRLFETRAGENDRFRRGKLLARRRE